MHKLHLGAETSAWVRVMGAMRQTAAAFSGGVDKLGAVLGKRRGVLRNEISPRSPASTAKLGLIDALRVMAASSDLRMLHAICLEFGHLAIPLPGVSADSASAPNVVALAKDFGELVSTYSDAVMDGRVTNVELAEVAQAWGELMVAGQALMDEVAAKNAALNEAQGIALVP